MPTLELFVRVYVCVSVKEGMEGRGRKRERERERDDTWLIIHSITA